MGTHKAVLAFIRAICIIITYKLTILADFSPVLYMMFVVDTALYCMDSILKPGATECMVMYYADWFILLMSVGSFLGAFFLPEEQGIERDILLVLIKGGMATGIIKSFYDMTYQISKAHKELDIWRCR